MEILLYLDLETTGLNNEKHAIHQIAGEIEVDGNTISEFDFKVRPHDGAEFDDKALKKGKVTKEEIMNYPSMSHVYQQLIMILSSHVSPFQVKQEEKFWIVGYNCASFDVPFLRKWFLRNGDENFQNYFWSAPLDAMVLAAQKLKSERLSMPNFQQATVAKKLGITVDEKKCHNAKYDLQLCKQIYKAVIK